MSEGIEKIEEEKSAEDIIAHKLEVSLQDKTGQSFRLAEYDGTYEIDADTFLLTFTIEDGLIEIRSIEVRGEEGLGGTIIRTAQHLAVEENCILIAGNVRDVAIGFWQKMGFVQTSTDGEYCWESSE